MANPDRWRPQILESDGPHLAFQNADIRSFAQSVLLQTDLIGSLDLLHDLAGLSYWGCHLLRPCLLNYSSFVLLYWVCLFALEPIALDSSPPL